MDRAIVYFFYAVGLAIAVGIVVLIIGLIKGIVTDTSKAIKRVPNRIQSKRTQADNKRQLELASQGGLTASEMQEARRRFSNNPCYKGLCISIDNQIASINKKYTSERARIINSVQFGYDKWMNLIEIKIPLNVGAKYGYQTLSYRDARLLAFLVADYMKSRGYTPKVIPGSFDSLTPGPHYRDNDSFYGFRITYQEELNLNKQW